jgi:hypothetical protein
MSAWLQCRGKNGSAASELAADAYPCIMVLGLWPAAYKVARKFVHQPAAPLGFVIPPTRASVPSCSKPSKDDAPCRGGRYAPILDRFCARRLHSIVGRGEETG